MINDAYTQKYPADFREMDTTEKIMWRSSLLQVPETLPVEKALNILKERIAHSDAPIKVRKISYPARYFMAAAVAGFIFLLAAWMALINLRHEEYIALRGQQTDYRLPDGSMAMLNADTRLSFNKGNFNKKRAIKMDGEAFFNIEKGSPFTIKTDLASIEILGTSFNLYSRGNAFKLSCFTGKVKVRSGSQTVIVSPMESVSLENNTLVLHRDENIYLSTGWRNGEFTFENSNLKLVFDEIERQYNVTFVLPEVDKLFFTGSISNKNLVEALDIVCIPMDLTYEIGSNSKILIKSKTD